MLNHPFVEVSNTQILKISFFSLHLCFSFSELVILHNNKEVQKISANNGEGLQVDCVMKPRFPPNSNCTWFYPTEDQVNSSTTWTADRSAYSLQIPKLRVKDSGDYNCKVNVSRRVISKDIEIEGESLAGDHLSFIVHSKPFPL